MNTKIKREVWIPIRYTNYKYQVSNFGRVKSIYTISSRGIVTKTGTILKPTINRNGYYALRLQWMDSGILIKKTKKLRVAIRGTTNLKKWIMLLLFFF